MNTAAALRLKTAGLWLAILSALTVGAVLVLQYGYGYAPCKLCLTERLPYYAAVPLGLAALLAPERLARIALGLAALGLLYGAGIGVYHAGAEWGFWPGPAIAAAERAPIRAQIGEFLNALQSPRSSTARWRPCGCSGSPWPAGAPSRPPRWPPWPAPPRCGPERAARGAAQLRSSGQDREGGHVDPLLDEGPGLRGAGLAVDRAAFGLTVMDLARLLGEARAHVLGIRHDVLPEGRSMARTWRSGSAIMVTGASGCARGDAGTRSRSVRAMLGTIRALPTLSLSQTGQVTSPRATCVS